MTYVHFVQADGLSRRAHLHVPLKGRRRLSAILREHDLDTGRAEPMFVSVTRANRLQKVDLGSFVDAISKPGSELQVMRASWPKTLVGPRDVITITYLPLGGGGGSQGGGRKSGLAIGASVAALLLAVVAPFAIPAIATTGLGFAAGSLGYAAISVAYAGVIIGLNYIASRAGQAKANKESDNRPVYGVSGGGNLPKPGDRIPVIYGQIWTTPALSQPDYSVYEGEDQTLFKRMTVGCGEYTLKAVRIGTQEVWRDGAYQNGLGAAVQLEFVAPGGASALVPSSVTASPDVAGIDLPRPGSSPEWAGPFPLSPVGVNTSILQFNIVCPGGIFAMGPTGSKFAGTSYATVAHPYIQYALADGNGNPAGPWLEVPNTAIEANSQKPVRRTFTINVPAGRYVARAKNLAAEIPSNQSGANGATWDFAGGYIPEAQIRPGISELAMKIKAGPGLSITQFSQIECLVQRKLPVYRGSGFVTAESRLALDAFVDICVDANYGAGMPPELVDLGKVVAYIGALDKFNTFDGQINGPISVWEAWSTVLGPMRAEPVQRGTVLSFQRDEQQAIRRHHFTRRQILSGSSAGEINLNRGEGTSSIRSEFYTGGDPRRRNEVTARYGPEPLASTLVNFEGVTDHEHATHLTRWTASSNFYRRETRRFRVELQHRSILPGDMIGVDTWFFSKGITVGVGDAISGTRYRLDGDVVWPATKPSPLYAFIIDRQGREFGPLGCTVDDANGWIDLNGSDISAAQVASGLTLAQALQPDDGGSTTHIRVGTLTELTENWIVKAVRPNDEYTADIEVVNDAPEVWDAIGEGYTTPPEVFEVEDTDPPIPRVRWVNATVAQVQQGLVCRWACAPTRGAVGYEVQVTRDGGDNWGPISNGPSTTGEFAIEHIEAASNSIRARGWGRFGVPGPWVTADFSTVQESITGELADEIQSLRDDIQDIADIGQATLDEGAKLIETQVKLLEERIDELAEALATVEGTSFLARDYAKIAHEQGFAAVSKETELRLTGDANEAAQRTVVASRLTNAEGTILAQAGVLQTYGTRIQQTENGLVSQSQSITTLDSRINNANGTIAGQASAVQQLQTTVTQQGNNITSLSQQITSLQSTINNTNGTVAAQANAVNNLTTNVAQVDGRLTATAQSVTALSSTIAGQGTISLTQLQQTFSQSGGASTATYGVAIAQDGNAIGGFRLTGLVRPGFPGVVQFGIDGNLLVSGSVRAQSIQANSITRGNIAINQINEYFGADLAPFATLGPGGVRIQSGSFFVPEGCTADILMIATVNWQGTPNSQVFGTLRINNVQLGYAGVLAANAFWTLGGSIQVGPGSHFVTMDWSCTANGGAIVTYQKTIIRVTYR
jgi:uncharacterized coiled-coil protein SlyX